MAERLPNTLAHLLLDRAHLQPWRRVLAAPPLGTAANQPTFKDDLRPGRPIERAVRSASVPSQLGGFTVRQPAFSPAPWQNFALNALSCGHYSRTEGASSPRPFRHRRRRNSANLPELSVFVCPFFPSSLCRKPLLRAKRKGGGICFELSSAVLGNQLRDSLNQPARQPGLSYLRVRFPGSNDRQECTFPGGSAGGPLSLNFPPFLRVSGTLRRESHFFTPRITNQSKTYATPSKTRNRPH
jgi:hypothetical protein